MLSIHNCTKLAHIEVFCDAMKHLAITDNTLFVTFVFECPELVLLNLGNNKVFIWLWVVLDFAVVANFLQSLRDGAFVGLKMPGVKAVQLKKLMISMYHLPYLIVSDRHVASINHDAKHTIVSVRYKAFIY